MKLTAAQKQAIEYANNDGELQIGSLDGRPVQRRVAERLVEIGIFVRSHTPLPGDLWWGYKLAK